MGKKRKLNGNRRLKITHKQFTILSLSNKFKYELLYHDMCNQVKKRNKLVTLGVWNIRKKDDKFDAEAKDVFVIAIITMLKYFAIDILIIYNAALKYYGNWFGYNMFVCGNIIILWNQNIITKPVEIKEENLVWLEDLKLLINIGKYEGNPSFITRDVLYKNKPRNAFICCGNFNSFDSNVKAKVNILDQGNTTFFIGKCVNKINIINTYNGLNSLALIRIYREIECTLGPRLMKIKEKDTINNVKRILNNEEPQSFPTLKKIVRWNPIKSHLGTITYIVGKLINNQVEPIFKKWNGIWSGFRKEPFLGKTIPDTVIFSYQVLLGDDVNKKYMKVDIPNNIDLGTLTKDVLKNAFYYGKGSMKKVDRMNLIRGCIKNINTRSEAANFDLYQVKDIVHGIRDWLDKMGDLATDGNVIAQKRIRNLLKNIIEKLNNAGDSQIMMSFFLLKNPKLENASDTRMIVITPTLMKIFEVIIYNEVVLGCNNIMLEDKNKWKYQYGARLNCSTTKAMVELRDKALEENVGGILFLDISKGYESVDLRILFKAVKCFIGVDCRLKYLLLCWISFVNNLDIYVAGKIIKKTKGIPMGLMLSPLMFVIYVDYLLRGFNNKKDLFMYIDDIALFLYEDESVHGNILDNIESMNLSLTKGNLFVNFTKANLLSESEKIIKIVKKSLPNIKTGNMVKYLGRELIIKAELLLPCDIDTNKGFFNLVTQVPPNAPLLLKISVLNGGLEAKNAFQAMMWEISIDARRNLFNRAVTFYSPSFATINPFEIFLLLRNYFRLGLGVLTVKKWLQFPTDDKDRINERLEIMKNAMTCGSYPVDKFVLSQFNNWFDYNDFLLNEDKDYFLCWKRFTKYMWNKLKRLIILEVAKTKSEFSKELTFCTFVGVETDEAIHYFSLIRRFAFALDAFFDLCDLVEPNNLSEYSLSKVDYILYHLNYHIEIAVNNIIIGRTINKFKFEKLESINRARFEIRREFFMKVAFINAVSKDGYKNIIMDKNWKTAINLAGTASISLFELFERELGGKQNKIMSISNMIQENKMMTKRVKKIRQEIIRWLIILDSIYKDNNVEYYNYEKMILYVNVMRDLYMDEIDKQKALIDIIDYQLDDEDKFYIDQNAIFNQEIIG